MYKLLSVFVAIYVLSLTLVPCVDNVTGCGEDWQIKTATTATDSHESHSDSCSPFCHCSCCNISMEVTAYVHQNAVFSSPRTLTFYISQKNPSGYIFSVWEPPKA